MRVEDNLRPPRLRFLIRSPTRGSSTSTRCRSRSAPRWSSLLAAPTPTDAEQRLQGPDHDARAGVRAQAGTVLAARGYDESHLLHRTQRTTTFQNMTAADIARKVAQTAGLQPGHDRRAGRAGPRLRPAEQRDRLGRSSGGSPRGSTSRCSSPDKQAALPAVRGARGCVRDHAALGRGAPSRSGRGSRASSRSTRSSCAAGTRSARQRSRRSRRIGRPTRAIGVERARGRRRSSAGTLTVADRPVASPSGRPTSSRESIAAQARERARRGGGRLPRGTRRPVAGAKLEIEGVGNALRRHVHALVDDACLPRRAGLRDALRRRRAASPRSARRPDDTAARRELGSRASWSAS